MPICIKENQKSAYLYLCGIKPAREVKLGEGITLIPASSNPNPGDMIDSIMKSDHASELELGVLIATLRMTTAQTNEKFYLASNAMWSYRLNFMQAIRISVIWSGIEALFMVDQNIKNTIAIVSSRFIYGNDSKIEDIRYKI